MGGVRPGVRPRHARMGRVFLLERIFSRKAEMDCPTIKLLGLSFVVHFVVFIVQCRGAAFKIEGGQYLLTRGGHIVNVLTQSEYFALSSGMLRMFAAGCLFAYFFLTMYWWYPRNRQPLV